MKLDRDAGWQELAVEQTRTLALLLRLLVLGLLALLGARLGWPPP